MKRYLALFLLIAFAVAAMSMTPAAALAVPADGADLAPTGASYTMTVGETLSLFLDNPYSNGYISDASWSNSNSFCVSFQSNGSSGCTIKANHAGSATISCSYTVRIPTGTFSSLLNCSQSFSITVKESSSGGNGSGSGNGDGSVTIVDATAIQRYLAELNTAAKGIGKKVK